ncbi:hypothetical protein LIA77_09340 [Sarocladium implicatum]|nr:hypothetical protein LIA77_09340 [Sarocladium implicatum]
MSRLSGRLEAWPFLKLCFNYPGRKMHIQVAVKARLSAIHLDGCHESRVRSKALTRVLPWSHHYVQNGS